MTADSAGTAPIQQLYVPYSIAADERPARVELTAADGTVDLRPIDWQSDGSGIQSGFGADRFIYPAGSLSAVGSIGGHEVRCGTPELQLAFHSHYERALRAVRPAAATALLGHS